MRQSLPIQFKVKSAISNLDAYLSQARQRVLTAQTQQERFKWLVIQAAIEAQIKHTQQPETVV